MYAGRRELRDDCFYRFCTVQALMPHVLDELVLPNLSSGAFERSRVRGYLRQQFPGAKDNTISTASGGMVDALVAGGIARADRNVITFAYRPVLLPSLAFILHSEFPEPGLHDLGLLEQN